MEEITQTQPQQPTQEQEGSDEPSQEDAPSIQEVDPEETRTQHTTWLEERVTALEKEKETMEMALQDMEVKMMLQENAMKEVVERLVMVEAAIGKIAEHIQRLDVFNESARTSINGVFEEVKKHQETFSGMATVLQAHELHIAQNGAMSQDMARFVNALIQDNETKRLWIESLARANQEQSEVLREHQMGQQVLAEMIKMIMAGQQQSQQPQPQQAAIGSGPVVSDVDDDQDGERLDFQGGPSQNPTPPDIGSLLREI